MIEDQTMLPILPRNVAAYRELKFQDPNLDSFVSAYGGAFLVFDGPPEILESLDGPTKTISLESYIQKNTGFSDNSSVFAVTRTGRSLFPDMISVGRTQNNDIYIPDASLSKFHAFFRQEGADFVIQDARSTNGTKVNHEKVPIQGEGEPVALVTGDMLLFGAVELSFYQAADFFEAIH